MEVFGSSGVRGIAPTELSPSYALTVAGTAGSVLAADRIAVGRDTRTTGRLLTDAVTSGLASVGCDVDRVGVVPTPALQAYCEREGVPGVMVTASHNPAEFNGIKLCGPDGVELTSDRLVAIEQRLDDDPALARWDEVGEVRSVDGANRAYREEVRSAVDREAIADSDLTIALDPGHGAGALTSPDLFRELGCSVRTVNAQPDGHFPGRDPEPIKENLGDLGELVRAADADVGIAHDGDGDRAIFFDETGSFVNGSAVLAALAESSLQRGDTVVSAANASQRLVDVCERADATLELTRIGSTYIITTIRELNDSGASVPVAGEGNGGIIFPDYRIARDGAYTAARFCELLTDATVSELVAPYDSYHNVRYDIHHENSDERAAMLEAIETAAWEADADLDTTDGYRLDYGDAWVLARPSGTEPVIRVYAEASSRDRAEQFAERLVSVIEGAR
ncbi:phosphoglucosamine mutase [Halovenus marina]|uniref:phosphoglucosamine mutase n=1 Tax=Halovenus marina TaxID=3396621 RepID=UPI003F557FB7